MAPSRPLASLLTAAAVLLTGLATGCGAGPETVGPSGVDGLEIPTPSPDPADFVEVIDNPWLPLARGNEWVYRSTGAEPGTITVTVTDETRVVAGVTATVVREVVADVGGTTIEETLDWFAQDREGNVWYLGEDTAAHDERGRPDTSGSWEAGVDGARAGLVMAATPRIGDGYQQESDPGNAEDRAVVVALDEVRDVAAGVFGDLLVTEDTTPVEPSLVERSYYARGTGVVYRETTSGGSDEVELISFTRG